jgi:hypothetical protein
VILEWDDPDDPDLAAIVITGDGLVEREVAPGIQTASYTGLTNGQLYSFTLRSRDQTGNLSAGLSIGVTPVAPPDTTPPGEVSSLSIQNFNGYVLITWIDPVDPDFDHARISASGLDDQVVWAGSQAAYFFSLANDSEYEFTLRTVDESSNTSEGTSIIGRPFDASMGGGTIGIDTALPEVLVVAFIELPAGPIARGETFSATIGTNAVDASINWYRNGQLINGVSTAQALVDTSFWALGTHQITVLVSSQGRLASASIVVIVQ